MKRQVGRLSEKLDACRSQTEVLRTMTTSQRQKIDQLEDDLYGQPCPYCGSRSELESGYGRDLFPGNMYDAAGTYYNICKHCRQVISYTY